MEGFKSLPKMQCFKEGGSVKPKAMCYGGKMKKGGEVDAADIKQDKAIVKKALAMHDKQEHPGEKTDLSKLRKGGRAKKAVGTVQKYKAGGSVTNVYEAKKSAGDKDNIRKVKDIAPTKANASSAAGKGDNTTAAFKKGGKACYSEGGSLKEVDAQDNPGVAKLPTNVRNKMGYMRSGGAAKKKFADGGMIGQGAISNAERAAMQNALPGGQGMGSANDMERRRMMDRAKNAMRYLGPQQQNEFIKQGGMSPGGVSQGAPAGSTIPAGQKRGGKVKKMNTGGTCS